MWFENENVFFFEAHLKIHRALQASSLISIMMHHVSSQCMPTWIFTSSTASSSVVNNCNRIKNIVLFVSLTASGQFIIMFSRVRDGSIYRFEGIEILPACLAASTWSLSTFLLFPSRFVRNMLNLNSMKQFLRLFIHILCVRKRFELSRKSFYFWIYWTPKKFSSRLSGKLFWGILITQMLFYGELWRISSGILRWDSTLDSRAKISLVISHQNIFPLCNRFINRSWKPQTKREQKK